MTEKKIKIDKIDKKILKEINWNARITNSDLAKKTNLSKKGVEYRLKRLENSNVIENYYPFINFMKLGYYYCRTFFKLQYLSNSAKKEIEDFIKNYLGYNWSLWGTGEYDLVIGAWTKSLKDFKTKINKFIVKFDKYIQSTTFSLGIQLDSFSYDFLTLDKSRNFNKMKESLDVAEIDKLDFLILKELTKNARVSLLDISKKLKSTPTSIKRRIKNLEEKKILLSCRASINLEKINHTHFKLLLYLNQKTQNDIEKIKEFLIKKLNTIYLVDEIGISDLDLELLYPSIPEFLDLINELNEKFSFLIKDHHYFIFTKTIKINFLPEDLEKFFS